MFSNLRLMKEHDGPALDAWKKHGPAFWPERDEENERVGLEGMLCPDGLERRVRHCVRSAAEIFPMWLM